MQGVGGGGMPPGTTISASTDPPLAIPRGTGAISGVVTDGATGRPLAGAAVSVFMQTTAPAAPFVGQHVTDSKGRFVFTDLGVAGYRVSVRRFGYIDAEYGNAGGGGRATISLATAEWFQKADVALSKTGALTGTVVDERGDPVVGVLVMAAREFFIAGRAHLAAGSSVRTDDRGAYRIAGLDPAQYAVCVPSVQATVPSAVALDATDIAGDSADGYRIVLGRGPMPDPRAGASFVYPTTCAPGGPSQGKPAAIEISARGDVGAVDVRLQPVRAFRVSGHVDGERGTGTLLRLVPSWAQDLGFAGDAATTSLESDGRFTFVNVPAGDYDLVATTSVGQFQAGQTMGPGGLPVARPPGFRMSSSGSQSLPSANTLSFTTINSSGAGLWGRSMVTVRDRDVTDAMLQLHRGVRLSGRLQFESSTGQVPPVAVLAADPANGEAALGMPTFAVQNPENGGEFSIDGLMAGSYLLRLRASAVGWAIKTVTAGGRDYLDAPFDASTGRDLEGVVVTMIDRLATISGSVREPGGGRTNSAAVIIFPVNPQGWASYGLFPTRLRNVSVTTSGAFEIARLQAGEYYVSAVDASEARGWQDPRWLEQMAGTATRVTVGWGETRSVDLTKGASR